MSYAQGTEHYNFPQIVGSDRPTFVDFNAAFRTIDTKLYGLEGDASTVDGRLDTIEAALPVMDAATQSAQNTADSAKAEADTNAEHITALEVLTGQHTTQIANKLDSVAIAEQYDPNAGTYNVGDIIVYNGQRYKCVTAVAVAEPFDADKWIGQDVETVLEEIKSDLSYKSVNGTGSTLGDSLASLKSVIDGLTNAQKLTSTITFGGYVLDWSGNHCYSCIYLNNSEITNIINVNINTGKAIFVTVATDGTLARVDHSTDSTLATLMYAN